MLLTVAIVGTGSGISTFAESRKVEEKTAKKTAEQKEETLSAQEIAEQIADGTYKGKKLKETKYYDTYEAADGSVVAAYYSSPVRFEDEDGKLKEYDSNLIETDDKEADSYTGEAMSGSYNTEDYAYVNTAGNSKQYFPEELAYTFSYKLDGMYMKLDKKTNIIGLYDNKTDKEDALGISFVIELSPGSGDVCQYPNAVNRFVIGRSGAGDYYYCYNTNYGYEFTHSWSAVLEQRNYLKSTIVKKTSRINSGVSKNDIKNYIKNNNPKVGDIIYFHAKKKNKFTHTAIISQVGKDYIKYAAHSDSYLYKSIKVPLDGDYYDYVQIYHIKNKGNFYV